MMKDFVENLYDYNYYAQKTHKDQVNDSDNEIFVSVEWENIY